ncbi:hypothetical protein D3C73_474830 [compost metagenome]
MAVFLQAALCHRVQDACADCGQIRRIIVDQHRKFVGIDSEAFLRPDDPRDRMRRLEDQPVARRVAEGIVDLPQMIDIDQEDTERIGIVLRPLLDGSDEIGAIAQPCEDIEIGKSLVLSLHLFAFKH